MAEPAPDQGANDGLWDGTRPEAPSVWRRAGSLLRANSKRLVWAAAVVAAGLAAYSYVSSPLRVRYAVVKTITTAETLGASGKVEGERVARLGLDIPGVVRSIYVKEGDTVAAGALIMSLAKSELDAKVRSARNAVTSALAELARASRPPLSSEIREARAELSQAISVGQARVAQAQARLGNLKSGSRPQEIKQAEAELKRTKQHLAKVQQDRDRIEQLVNEGAVAQSDLDQARSEVDSAQTDMVVQEQRLSLLKAGPRPGEVEEAEAALAEAKASRDTSVKAAQERLNTLLSLPRREDVEAARARVDEARAQLAQAGEARSKSDLRAPFEGVVAGIPVEQGQSISPGQTLVVLHEMAKPVIEVETDEENLSVLSVGQQAVVSSDAYPGRTFNAALYDLGSQVNPERGTITVKLRPLDPVTWLRPDLTVDVNIITRRNVRRTVLPPDTLTKAGGRSVVLVIRDCVTVPVPVRTGAAGPVGVAVYGDLKNGDIVARDASEVEPNVDVVCVRRK